MGTVGYKHSHSFTRRTKISAFPQKLDGINTVMQENLAGVRVVKAFVRGRYEIGRFAQANDA